MVSRTGVLGFWVCLGLAAGAGAEPMFLDMPRAEVERVIAMGYEMDAGTEAKIERLRVAFPESPVPGVLEAGFLYWLQNYQEWDEELKGRFEEQSARALKVAESYQRLHPLDPDARFAVAMVELMQVIYFVDERRWWAAFWKSRSSMKTMRDLVAEYPNFHDAKLPLGMQHCYLSRTPGYLKPLAFLMRSKGDWDLGLSYLREARDGGLFCSADAGFYLSRIRLELEGDRQAARDEMAKLVLRYPGNLKFQGLLAELERGLGGQDLAMARSLEVLADERVEQFPGIRGRTLVTLLWSSLGANELQRSLETVATLRKFAAVHEGFDYDLGWVDFVEAEALWGLGRKEEATALWGRLTESADSEISAAARSRQAP